MKNQKPPRIAEKILHGISDPQERCAIIGDFSEIYSKRAEKKGRISAGIWYWSQLMISVPSFIKWFTYGGMTMLKNYLKLAMRNAIKNKTYSFINLTGLTSGILCFLLILLYVSDELSYDRHHPDSDRLFRLIHEVNAAEVSTVSALSAAAWTPALTERFGDIEKYVRLKTADTKVDVRYKNRSFALEKFAFAEEDFFNIFSIPLLQGDPASVLKEPFTVVLNEDIAKILFGNENPIGKTIFIGNGPVKVTGITGSHGKNSHMDLNIIVSFKTYEEFDDGSLEKWFEHEYYTYVLLSKNSSRKIAEDKFTEYYNQLVGDKLAISGTSVKLLLQPVKDIHLRSNIEFEIGPNGNIMTVYLLSVSAVFILFIACFNYINLAISRMFKKAREIGIRKVIGAERSQIMQQYLSESVLTAFLSFAAAVLIIILILPWFNDLTGKEFEWTVFFSIPNILIAALSVLTIGLLSGGYPAYIISSFQAVKVIGGRLTGKARKMSFRNILVVLQFSITILLLSGTYIIYDQFQYMLEKDTGFNSENLVVIDITSYAVKQNSEKIKQAFMQIPEVKNVGFSASVPGGKSDDKKLVRILGDDIKNSFVMQRMKVDYDLVPTAGIELAYGRNYSRDFQTDTKNFLINETAAKRLGFDSPGEAVGKTLRVGGRRGTIIGVVKDFHIKSVHSVIEPMVFYMDDGKFIFVRISSENTARTLESMKSSWASILPESSFDYYFLDDKMAGLYKSEESLGDIFRYFSIIALLTSCLGLYGLLLFAVEQCRKEIGIRKALGASVRNIYTLLAIDYFRSIFIAFVLAIPAAYWLMNYWLNSFAYSIEVTFRPLMFAAMISFIIALFTISIQTIKAARANPVDSLRYE